MHFSNVPLKIVAVSEFFSTLSAKDFFFRSFLFSSEKGSVSNVWFYFLYLFRGTWRCFLLMNFEVSCQIPFSRKWFSAFRAEHRCPINLFVVMCLDMSVKVLLVWCFVSARWTCEDFFIVSFFLLCFLMWFLCVSFPMKFSLHTGHEKGRLSCALNWWTTRSTSFAKDFAHSLQRKSILF